MERNDETVTDAFLETVRKELNVIIKEELEKEAASSSTATMAKTMQFVEDQDATANADDVEGTEKGNRLTLLNTQASKTIDQDLQKMQLHLQQSYELFQIIGDRFEAINFGGLKSRIKNLHSGLSANGHEIGSDAVAELRELFQQSYLDNRLEKLTNEVGGKMRHHPGEFGDIPEVSAFFKACTQLQHGLEQLRRQRDEVNALGKRICWAAKTSYDRIDEIQRKLSGQQDSFVKKEAE